MHPDRRGTGSASAMATLNAAHHTLSDPGRRAIYDRSLHRTSSAAGDATGTPVHPSAPPPPAPATPARIPWRLMAVLGTLGVVAVGISAAVAGDPEPPTPDGI